MADEIEKQELEQAVADALAIIQNRTYSARHPELGSMIKCPVCNRRHRQTLLVGGVVFNCVPQYAKDANGNPRICQQVTRKGQVGAAAFAKKRWHPHPSKRKLQLVERTQKLYSQNEPYIKDPVECMQESRKQAQRELKRERAAKRKRAK